MFYKKQLFSKISQNSLENTYVWVSILAQLEAPACNDSKKETPTKMFSFEFWEILWKLILQNILERVPGNYDKNMFRNTDLIP